ncbi:MAG: hypothetical protein HDR05_12525 [Lachnospiraceae bacterium]|nr:hypothetical protein [Lachnospiraceae bacterium]
MKSNLTPLTPTINPYHRTTGLPLSSTSTFTSTLISTSTTHKILSITAISIAIMSLTACGTNQDTNDQDNVIEEETQESEPIAEEVNPESQEPEQEEPDTTSTDPTPSPEPTIEISDEDYCYISLLEGMFIAPEYYWYTLEELNNTPENNKFALIDIDQDGSKEFLNEYTSISSNMGDDGIFKLISIYSGKENISVFSDAEIYSNGIIIDNERRRYESLSIYKGTDEVNSIVIYDKSLLEDYGEDFPEDLDTDNDGIIYVWIDTERNDSYLTTEEHNDRLNSLIGDAERIEIPWQNITRENIANIYPYTLPEDNSILEEGSVIWTYIADQVNTCKYDGQNDIAGFIECYFSLHHFEDCLQDILPSAEVVYDDGTEDIIGYNLSLADINNIAKNGFQREVTIEDLVSQGMKDIGDNKVQISLEPYGLMPSYHMQIVETEQEQDQSTQIIKGICNCIGSEGESITGYKFSITIEKNPESSLGGYEIKACEVEEVAEERRIAYY